ncbi:MULTISPECIES: ribosome recycling factor [Dehalobacter]|jgi:ribosome recycling factor|uniref:Ribosome-recycling factor n=2 Tax=Dehalobacter restrictus TaxID=55583 RepID=A0A857DIN4_9FIRM|nr:MULTISPECIES: ribosome recycling factor [Dehalobacter]AHF09612.1 ribosome recycling factor [Dehalobacter restrictus DSM 9455]MCG1026561.1 ribosome recycling factor [Dehalobacter sp.]MDJ0304350.1 ribosome recycling factor [Dehalobacter sp.]OCZ54951.1 ribosome recycling factor [Dehalobacter sp. TeCB1]QHA00205.1 ribosome recycling factor [Dehalobacter restrictus]
MLNDFLNDAEEKMHKTEEVLKKDLASVRAGRANPAVLDKVSVDYYGTPTPINQLANVSVPDPRMITIQPWDKSSIKDIEKAILKSDLGLTPSNDGMVIRLNIPQLTAERRAEIVKTVKKKAEDAKVAVRNIRRELIDDIKQLEKDKTVSEDDSKKGQEKAQKLTDKTVKDIDEILEKKEKEIMEV